MHRFYLPPEECRGSTLHLSEREAHHALHVLRIQRGERVTVLDGAGHELLCQVSEAGKKEIQLTVVEKKSSGPQPFEITLLQAVPKGKSFELIIQKATELGASRIVPILSERVVTQLDKESGEHKVEKWQQVAIEAIKQCGSTWLPRVETPRTPKQFLASKERFDLSVVGSLHGDRKHPHQYFQEFQSQNGRKPASVCIWIGPEGDFTLDEINLIKDGGALPISLGPLVLRSETAAIYCLSFINYELQSP